MIKNCLLVLVLMLLLGCTKDESPKVYFPDEGFKSHLIGRVSLNTNGDNEISVSEAAAYTGKLIASGRSFTDLTGIEAFTGIDELHIIESGITSIDLSSNVELEKITISNSNLLSLDLTNNIRLTTLSCGYNKLTKLDLSNNIALSSLYCYHNEITHLDLSNLSELDELFCNDNNLVELNIKNGNSYYFDYYDLNARNNPSLLCITVDDGVFAEDNYRRYVDDIVFFSTYCP